MTADTFAAWIAECFRKYQTGEDPDHFGDIPIMWEEINSRADQADAPTAARLAQINEQLMTVLAAEPYDPEDLDAWMDDVRAFCIDAGRTEPLP
jgi:hypothetical protein